MFIPIGDQLINAVSFGSCNTGETLLAHGGWTGSWELWQQPMELLSRRMRVVSYDHRGTGQTKTEPVKISARALVTDLFGVMDALEIERCTLACESSGSFTAIKAAAERPERFSGLVIVAGAVSYSRPDGSDPFCQALLSDYHATISKFADNCVPEVNSEHIRAWGRDILARSTPEQAVRLIEIMYGTDLTPLLPLLHMPVLVIHGADDVIVPSDSGRLIASSVPDSRLVILENTGHVPTLTRPYEVARLIEEFFFRS